MYVCTYSVGHFSLPFGSGNVATVSRKGGNARDVQIGVGEECLGGKCPTLNRARHIDSLRC